MYVTIEKKINPYNNLFFKNQLLKELYYFYFQLKIWVTTVQYHLTFVIKIIII